MVPKSIVKTNGNSNKAGKFKIAAKKKNNMPVYKAIRCPRPAVVPSMKFPRGSEKFTAYEKIVKLLTTMEEPSTSESEKSAALNLAQRQCQRYGIDMDQALVETEYRKKKYNGGSSSVLVKRNDNQLHKTVRTQTFLVDLCDAMEMMFDCHAYTELDKGRLRITFYGVDKHTVAAQIAFVNAYNQAANMGQAYRGIGQKNSYLLGVAKGMWNRAMMRKTNIAADMERAQALAASLFDNNMDLDDENFEADIEFEDVPLGEIPERFNEDTCREEDRQAVVKAWVGHMIQVAQDRAEAEESAAEFLRQRGIKLRAQRKGKKIIRHQQFFDEGVNDAYDIDIGEKRMCEALQTANTEEENQEARERRSSI